VEPEFVSSEDTWRIIIEDSDEMIEMIRRNIKELAESRQEILDLKESKKATDFWCDVELERCRRAQEGAVWCLKSTQRQKKIAIMELNRLND
jgi:hypothetical protein